MRVPVYQQQVTPQIPSVRTQVQVPDGAAGVAVKPIDTTAGIAQGVESLRLGIMKLQENKEQFELAQTVTEFRRRNTEFLNAKDTGIFAQQGENVFGSTERYTKFATELAEELAKSRKWSGPARQRFISAIDNVVNYSTQSVMRFEQDASEKVKNAVFEGTIAQAYQDASAHVRDEALFRDALDTAVSASVERWAPFGQEKVAAETKKLESQFYSLRIASILQDDPRAAQAMFEKNRNALLPDMQVRLDASIKNKMELIETQEMGDQLIRRFGSNEAAGLAFIRKNFEGEEERRYVAEFKTRSSELRSRMAQGRAALSKSQTGFYKVLKTAVDNGQTFSLAQLNSFVKDGKLSADHVPTLLTHQAERDTRPRITQRLVANLAAEGTDFYALSETEQEEKINAEAWRMAGYPTGSKKRSEDYAAYLEYKLKTGDADKETVKREVKRGLISAKAGADALERAQAYSKAQGYTLKQHHNALEDLLRNQYGLDKATAQKWLLKFEQKAEGVSKKDEHYDENLDKVGEEIAAQAFVDEKLPKTSWGFFRSGAAEALDKFIEFSVETPGIGVYGERKRKADVQKKLAELDKKTTKEVTQNAGKQQK